MLARLTGNARNAAAMKDQVMGGYACIFFDHVIRCDEMDEAFHVRDYFESKGANILMDDILIASGRKPLAGRSVPPPPAWAGFLNGFL